MSNNNNDINQNDIYVDNPDEGRSRERVVDNNPQTDTRSQNERPSDLTASTTREQALQASAQRGQGPISSGQQSSTSSDASGVGGYGTPESGFGSDAQGGSVAPKSGYNQASYNQQGTYSQGQGDLQPNNDGLQDTLGSGYDQQQNNPDMAQRGYDPAKSGVKPAHDTPGEVVDTPGRDVGSAWGQDGQMGSSTDTADRRNPGA
ncbi:MAG: hypothetical protein NVS4B11_33430 [Ktedonobacteraceae bacterium]